MVNLTQPNRWKTRARFFWRLFGGVSALVGLLIIGLQYFLPHDHWNQFTNCAGWRYAKTMYQLGSRPPANNNIYWYVYQYETQCANNQEGARGMLLELVARGDTRAEKLLNRYQAFDELKATQQKPLK